MTIQWSEKLATLIPLPATPIDTDKDGLQQNERILGVTFPSDYVKFGLHHGSGRLSVKEYTWELYSPARKTLPNFIEESRYAQGGPEPTDNFRKPVDWYSVPGEPLPFGCRDDVYFCFRTDGRPDDWKVIVTWDYYQGEILEYDMGFSEFLVRMLEREIIVGGFKSPWNPKTDISFVAHVHRK